MADMHDEQMEEGSVRLAPLGESPWQHSVRFHQGKLVLYWQEHNELGAVETRTRTFTRDETKALMKFLDEKRELM